MTLSRPKAAWVLAVVLAGGISAGVVAPARDGVLRAAGHALVWGDPLAPADAIVVTVDSDGAGVLEAADLFRRGIARRVALFSDPPDEVDAEFLKRGVPYEDEAARSTRQLEALGVNRIERIARVSGTQQEGEVLPRWCDETAVRSIVVIAEPDHSRRLRRVLERAMNARPIKVMIRPTSYSKYDPADWWRTRGGVRTQIVESQKLLLDYVLHPF